MGTSFRRMTRHTTIITAAILLTAGAGIATSKTPIAAETRRSILAHSPDSTLATLVAATSTQLPGKQVWAHMVPHGLADYHEKPGKTDYGSAYPLDLIPGGPSSPPRLTSGLPRAQAAGLTGMQILTFEGINRGSDFTKEWMKQADPTWNDSHPDNDFSIAPCFMASSSDGLIRMIREYLEIAKEHASAAKIGDKFVIYIYGPRNMPPQQWEKVRDTIDQQQLPVYLIGDLQTDSSQTGHTLDASRIDTYAHAFDAAWNFEDSSQYIWNDILRYAVSRSLPYAGGIMPGYNRETPGGGIVDAQGTTMMRNQWEAALTSGAPWQNIITWNDLVEHTDIKPSSDWNITRSDINAFYAAKLRGLPPPAPRAELYITTPNHTRAGQTVHAEALILNGGKTDVIVNVQLHDGSGAPIGEPIRMTAPAGKATAATTNTPLPADQLPSRRFLRAHAWSLTTGGTPLQHVVSAPVVVYGANEKLRTTNQRTHYYSIPAARALPTNPTLSLTGDATQGNATLTAAHPMRFVEILQNTRSAKLSFDTAIATNALSALSRTIVGNQKITTDSAGFYVGRIIDSNERVAYSDPVYISDPRS